MRRESVKKGPCMTHPVNQTPVNPLPPVVAALALVMAGFELAFNLGARGLIGGQNAVGWRNTLVERFGFSGRAFDWMLENGTFPPEHLIRFVTYPFFHANFTHALFAVVILRSVDNAWTLVGYSIVFWALMAYLALPRLTARRCRTRA